MPISFNIGNRCLGQSEPVFIIAEVAQAHDGSLGTAHAYIDAAASRGADAIKFQTHIADAESSAQEQFRIPFSYQDKSRFDYWKRMEFTREQWAGLAAHARQNRLIFLSSPFSEHAVDLLDEIGCPAWKVGSGEVASIPLINRMIATKKPLLLSSGLSDWNELDRITRHIRSLGGKFAILQCTTAYPCPPENWGLNNILEISNRYGCLAGYSDHSGTVAAGLAAVTLGANIIEVHITFSRECFGPDVSSSLTLDQFEELVRGTRQISTAKINPVNKALLSPEAEELKKLFGKSIFITRNLCEGHTLNMSDFEYKKPGDGIPAAVAPDIAGKKLAVDLKANEMLRPEHIQDQGNKA
jgi:N,N'-diacetyllegionaminate synthase